MSFISTRRSLIGAFDPVEALVDLVEALVDLVEALVDLVEAPVDLLVQRVQPIVGPALPHRLHDSKLRARRVV